MSCLASAVVFFSICVVMCNQAFVLSSKRMLNRIISPLSVVYIYSTFGGRCSGVFCRRLVLSQLVCARGKHSKQQGSTARGTALDVRAVSEGQAAAFPSSRHSTARPTRFAARFGGPVRWRRQDLRSCFRPPLNTSRDDRDLL